MERKTLIDVFPTWAGGGGIFTALDDLEVPWNDEDIATELDLAYYGNRSGDKYASPLITKLMEGDTLTASEVETIAATLFAIYSANWAKQYATISLQYDPITNYSMTETGEDTTTDEYGKTTTRTDDLTHTRTGTDTLGTDTTETRTDDLTHTATGTQTTEVDNTVTTTPDLTTITDNSVYGFDSENATPSGRQSVGSTGTNTDVTDGEDTITRDLTDTDTGTQTTTTDGTETRTYDLADADAGTQTTADAGEDTRTVIHSLTREGNIGVTTSQQMIESERALWVWNFFYDVVFPDVDKMLTLNIY